MKCLCCGKELKNGGENGWHKACIKNFFGVSSMPKIEIDNGTLEEIAKETTSMGYTVPGVQKKLSLHLLSENGTRPRLTLVNYPTGYILKPQVPEFEALPQAENLAMCMAEKAGISVVPHALIEGNGTYAYITKRIDRVFEGGKIKMLAMEDFCQLDFRLTQDKYKGSYERCAKVIRRYSNRSGLDMTEFFLRLVFSFIIGNSDMHLKNFSLIETDEGSGKYVLSPAYDLLFVNVIMPEDKEQFALAMNGKKTNIRKKDFLIFADGCGLSRVSAEKMIANLVKKKDIFISMCGESLLPDSMKERLSLLIEERAASLA